MTRRKTSSSNTPERAELTNEQIEQGLVLLKRRSNELSSFDPSSATQDEIDEAFSTHSTSIKSAIERVFAPDSHEAFNYSDAHFLHTGGFSIGMPKSIQEIRKEAEDSKKKSLGVLGVAIRDLEERRELAGLNRATQGSQHTAYPANANRKVFVVHGHDDAIRLEVTSVLDFLEFEPIVLNELPSQSKSIIEKIEANDDVGFAVVLMTPDDFGGKVGADAQPRPRQNVILELGYFLGKLGRPKVCALKKANFEIPSDFVGPIWIEVDDRGAWKMGLAKELKAAHYDVDFNKILG